MALSSVEAEQNGAGGYCTQILWINQQVNDLGKTTRSFSQVWQLETLLMLGKILV